MRDFDPILTESRNWSNVELQGRAVQAEKNSHKNILSEKAAKKSHEASNCELHKTKFKQTTADIDMPFHRLRRGRYILKEYDGVVQTFSPNWKQYFAKN